MKRVIFLCAEALVLVSARCAEVPPEDRGMWECTDSLRTTTTECYPWTDTIYVGFCNDPRPAPPVQSSGPGKVAITVRTGAADLAFTDIPDGGEVSWSILNDAGRGLRGTHVVRREGWCTADHNRGGLSYPETPLRSLLPADVWWHFDSVTPSRGLGDGSIRIAQLGLAVGDRGRGAAVDLWRVTYDGGPQLNLEMEVFLPASGYDNEWAFRSENYVGRALVGRDCYGLVTGPHDDNLDGWRLHVSLPDGGIHVGPVMGGRATGQPMPGSFSPDGGADVLAVIPFLQWSSTKPTLMLLATVKDGCRAEFQEISMVAGDAGPYWPGGVTAIPYSIDGKSRVLVGWGPYAVGGSIYELADGGVAHEVCQAGVGATRMATLVPGIVGGLGEPTAVWFDHAYLEDGGFDSAHIYALRMSLRDCAVTQDFLKWTGKFANGPFQVMLWDFNRDGLDDIVLGGFREDSVIRLWDGGLQPTQTRWSPNYWVTGFLAPMRHLVDVDLDGYPDVVDGAGVQFFRKRGGQ